MLAKHSLNRVHALNSSYKQLFSTFSGLRISKSELSSQISQPKTSVYRTNNNDVELNYKVTVNSPDLKPMIFVHGLFGSMNNWRSISMNKKIARKRNTILIDARNHGLSDHHDEMDYANMADDVIMMADRLNLDKFTILGHSMGGKIAMTLTCRHPDRVDGLVTVDSAPYDYNTTPKYVSYVQHVVDVVKDMDIIGYEKRDLLKLLEDGLGSKEHAQLLLMNTQFGSDNKCTGWKINMDSICKNVKSIFNFDADGQYEGPVLALVACNNRTFYEEDFEKSFPYIEETQDPWKHHHQCVIPVKGAGHWVQADKPIETIQHISNFLEKVDDYDH